MLSSTEFHWFPRHIRNTALISSRLGVRLNLRCPLVWEWSVLVLSGETWRRVVGTISAGMPLFLESIRLLDMIVASLENEEEVRINKESCTECLTS
ncbi:unnamed protein product [Pseudo-nitzschia multistriata]|uniref:Uncharacterized protein n=1 Tax=Pseudo-nitzschia multistriata TaxID=183589 RepID=A0A448ZBA9_9STRA|nr:unnamed protein product [Pseudo-nitzschia multistriata]